MEYTLTTRASLVVVVVLGWTLLLCGQATTPISTLEGVWGATRDFGPAARGTLDITQLNGSWHAEIAQYVVAVTAQANHLSFDFPASQGSFVGRLGANSVIRGQWIQPPTVNDGSKFASLVVLHPKGKDRWQGNVVPREDEFTLYLVVKRRPDGSLGAFLRNPDRNVGVQWNVDRVEQDGNHLKLVGKRFNKGPELVFGEGSYYPDEKWFSLYFPLRGGTYDFVRVSDDSTPGFYARGKNPPLYEYRPPTADDDGWKVGTLAEVGMSSEPIAELVREVEVAPTSLHDADIHGFLVARHGKLVVEEYFHGFNKHKPHDTRSAAKVVAATLVGAAMQNGAKLDVSTGVYDLIYKGSPPPDMDTRKKDMTVEHLLTMSSGYNCDDWEGGRPGSEETLLDDQPDADYYRYTLQLPMELKPGEQAVYCSINPNLLGAVLTAATQEPVSELFDDLLAQPLQIQSYYLNLQPTGEPYLGGGMKFLPRDFMKFGQLMLDGGVWNGKRILSHEYALRASTPLVALRGETHGMRYGYFWWTLDYKYKDRTVRAYFAAGNGGQEVVVIPDLDMVIACYGGNYADSRGWVMVREYIPKFILPALRDESR